ncbi:MAG: exonuclease domain-containing protein [Oscillospiraceae bacterium]|nr:exonuclease domain-containing protein [Oscillospiraceae bacterium]MDY6208170.1 3'-5' exonuclease [Oscillospiraceae bacterium]
MPKNHSKIILDLEFNPVRVPEIREKMRSEIIEIGAVKLDDSLREISTFDEYIKPEHNTVEEKISSLTGITNEQLAPCGGFHEVMHRFMDWIGEEPFSLYSWSLTDMNVMLDEIDYKYPEDESYDRFFVHWIDLQRIYQRQMGFFKSMGLTNALGTLNIYFDGTEHGALADARNTAEIMRYMSDGEKMKAFRSRSHVTYNTSDSSGFSLGNITIKRK